MKIFLNEKPITVQSGMTAFQLKYLKKRDADVVVLNGFIIKEDVLLKENDRLTLIKKGEILAMLN